jgi:dihydropteroate synthase
MFKQSGSVKNGQMCGPDRLETRHGDIDVVSRTVVMGILNVTADSFSDGGRYLDRDKAVAHGLELARQGAAIIDIGGESTRPGATPATVVEEINRVVPVIQCLRRHLDVPISIDTYKAEVAQRALAAGADIVNDVSALRFDREMAGLIAAEGVPVVLMHMRGEPRTMQNRPEYHDVVAEVREFLRQRIAFAVTSGIRENAILIDPGIGFGKNLYHNLELIGHLQELASLGRPILVGLSRKSFIGQLLDVGPDERLEGSLAAAVAAALGGAQVLRAHDVLETCRALRIADAIRTGK